MLKMADQGMSDFYVVFTMRAWIETNVNKFAISNHMALKIDLHALRSYLRPMCKYKLYILPNKKLVPQRIMVKTTWGADPGGLSPN